MTLPSSGNTHKHTGSDCTEFTMMTTITLTGLIKFYCLVHCILSPGSQFDTANFWTIKGSVLVPFIRSDHVQDVDGLVVLQEDLPGVGFGGVAC